MPALQARQFSVLYNLVAKICQDQSTDGVANAKQAVNTIIQEVSKQFKLPQMLIGQDQAAFVSPTVGIGVQQLTLATNVSRVENVYWIDNSSVVWPLEQISDDLAWLERVDQNSQGNPLIYRVFLPNSAGNNVIQIWTAPGSGWVSQSGGKLYYTYWSELVQLVNDTDVPAIPYELDTVLVNGGIVEMSRMQGDSTLLQLYEPKYIDDLGEIRAWLIKQRSQDAQMEPDAPMGVYGRERGVRGYKPS